MALAGIIAGLGNSGKEYQANRHNIGFHLADILHDNYGSEAWRTQSAKTAKAVSLARASIGGDEWLLVKPQSYMNLSGMPIAAVLDFYKITPDNLWVIHDEIDLPFAKIRSKFGGGSAGHNGLKDITQHIGADYHRLRIGIGRPSHISDSAIRDFVLHDFSKTEAQAMQSLLNNISTHIGDMLDGNDSDFIRKTNPQN